MKTPPKLYRYRPLEDGLLNRELDALSDSFLYAPPFTAMNDPMEAFYQTGGPGDRIINAMLVPAGNRIAIRQHPRPVYGRVALHGDDELPIGNQIRDHVASAHNIPFRIVGPNSDAQIAFLAL